MVSWLSRRPPIPGGPAARGAAAYGEPLCRALAVQIGALRAVRTGAVLAGRWLVRGDRHPAGGHGH